MYKNGKMYNLEVLYDEISNTVYYFEYARKAMGNLPAIPKQGRRSDEEAWQKKSSYIIWLMEF